MSVTLRKMTREEFDRFYQWSIDQQAQDLMAQSHISREAAVKEAAAEITGMLPLGFHTEQNDFITIVADGENVGFLWTLQEETAGKQQCFLCDFAIWESNRRKGHGAAALRLMEANAASSGCQEIVLFVRADNAAAIALYQKSGYQVLRPAGNGNYMVKPLSP